jgi:hypothetical protein
MQTDPYQGISMFPEGRSVEYASIARQIGNEAYKAIMAPSQNVRSDDKLYSGLGLLLSSQKDSGLGRTTGNYNVIGKDPERFGHLQGIDLGAALTTLSSNRKPTNVDYSTRMLH